MTIIRELITSWGFNVDTKPLDGMESKVAGLKTGLKAVAGLAATGAATLFAWTRAAANAGDDAAKTARTLGVSAESYQELAYAADFAGVKTGQLEKALSKINTTTRDAIGGNADALKQFRALGVGLDDLRDKRADEILMLMADGFAALPDGVDKASIAVDWFGDRNSKMVNLLDGGADALRDLRLEAIATGNVIGEETTKKAERFNDAITRIRKLLRGLVLLIGADLVDNFTDVAEGFALWIAESRELIKLRLEQAIGLTVNALKMLWKWSNAIAKSVSRLVNALGGAERALRIVGILLATFVAFKVVVGITALSGVVMALAAAYKTMGMAALVAKAKVMLLPLAIAALIVLIGLVIDDFKAFFAGQDSAIGELVKKWPELGWAIDAVRHSILVAQEAGAAFLMWLLGPAGEKGTSVFHRWGNAIGDAIFNGVQSAKASILGFIPWVKEKIASIPGIKQYLSAMEASKDFGARMGELVGDKLGIARAGADARGAQARSGTSNTFQGGPMNITQLPGESGEDFARRVSIMQREEWARQMRMTQDDLDQGVVY
jgi:hypothetical protein